MNNVKLKKQANIILYELGLWNHLKSYGEPHIVGSYRMDLMTCNDLDIDITNSEMSIDKLYELSDFIIKSYKPIWYEAKQETTDDGDVVWFHGFETTILGELWNFDLWFFDEKTIFQAEQFCDDIVKKINANPIYRDLILDIKVALINNNHYGYGKYTSMNVYEAVLEKGVKSVNEFINFYAK